MPTATSHRCKPACAMSHEVAAAHISEGCSMVEILWEVSEGGAGLRRTML